MLGLPGPHRVNAIPHRSERTVLEAVFLLHANGRCIHEYENRQVSDRRSARTKKGSVKALPEPFRPNCLSVCNHSGGSDRLGRFDQLRAAFEPMKARSGSDASLVVQPRDLVKFKPYWAQDSGFRPQSRSQLIHPNGSLTFPPFSRQEWSCGNRVL